MMLQAQQTSDSVRQVVKSEPSETEEEPFSFVPAALRLGVDVSRLTTTLLELDASYYEANADLQFGRYFLAFDAGTGHRQRSYSDQLTYQVDGNYFRLGGDLNMIPDNKDNNVLFIGLRYGRSYYTEQLSTTYSDPVFSTSGSGTGSFPVEVNRPATARWFEGVAGMKAQVWGGLFLGYTIRYKLGLKTFNTGSFASYEVPGFGKVGDGNTFAFNYHVFYRIPFK